MLPDHPLLRTTPLRSVRAGTSIDPRNLILQVGLHTVDAIRYTEDGKGSDPVEAQVYDNSFQTRFHEGIHWRQLNATSFGAFFYWLRHARELDFVTTLKDLPPERRHALFVDRRAGRRIIDLDPRGHPTPPIALGQPVDPVALMRCVFLDNFLVETLFIDAAPISTPYAPFEEIFASTMADASTALPWLSADYEDLQRLFTFPPGRIQRLKVHDRPGEPEELTTRDVMEAGAVANELMFIELFDEKQYRSAPDDALGLVSPSTTHDPAYFSRHAERFLQSGHGFAIRHFFRESRLSPDDPGAWGMLMIASDFALNPPLPPMAFGGEATSWFDLYPPLRFHFACKAARTLGGAPHPLGHDDIAASMDGLSELTGLTSSVHPAVPPNAGEPDFAAVVRDDDVDELYRSQKSYYDFLRWCHVRLLTDRRNDLRLSAAPAYLAWQLAMDRKLDDMMRALNGFGRCPPVMSDPEGHLDHASGSSSSFGTWFAISMRLWGLLNDLAFGDGEPDSLGYPQELLRNETAREWILASFAATIGEDPWGNGH